MKIEQITRLIKEEEKYQVKDGRLFFVEPPADAHISLSAGKEELDQARWSNWRRTNFQYFKKHLAGENKHNVFLDIGAGPSRFRELTQQFPNFIGTDFYPYDLVQVVANFTKPLPFRDAIADIVLLSNILEHIPIPELLLKECYRVIKPGGKLLGAVPFLIKIHQEPYDFLRYTNFMLEKMFKEAGFQAISVETLGRPVDLFLTMQRRFFAHLASAPLRRKEKFFVRLAMKMAWFTNKIFYPLYCKALPSYKFTEGYGFFARKGQNL